MSEQNMISLSLKKALKGDTYSLIEMTEKIESNTLLSGDLAELRRHKTPLNPHQDYLLACCYYSGCGVEKNHQQAQDLIKQHASRGDGFSQNLLAIIYKDKLSSFPLKTHGVVHYISSQHSADLTNEKKTKDYLIKSSKQGNPLGMMNYALQIHLFDDDTLPNFTLIFSALSLAYKQVTPFYQKKCIDRLNNIMQGQFGRSGKEWIELARFYEKIGLKTEMYQAFHRAIDGQEDSSRYIRKMIKAVDRTINKDIFFKQSLDVDFIEGYLKYLSKKIQSLETKAKPTAELADMAIIQSELQDLAIRLKTMRYIVEETGSEYKPDKLRKIQASLSAAETTCDHVMAKAGVGKDSLPSRQG